MSRISSLVSGGSTIRNACGMTIETIARLCDMPERAGRLHLALGHRLDAGPDGLGHVGGADQAERQHHRARTGRAATWKASGTPKPSAMKTSSAGRPRKNSM